MANLIRIVGNGLKWGLGWAGASMGTTLATISAHNTAKIIDFTAPAPTTQAGSTRKVMSLLTNNQILIKTAGAIDQILESSALSAGASGLLAWASNTNITGFVFIASLKVATSSARDFYKAPTLGKAIIAGTQTLAGAAVHGATYYLPAEIVECAGRTYTIGSMSLWLGIDAIKNLWKGNVWKAATEIAGTSVCAYAVYLEVEKQFPGLVSKLLNG